MNKRKQADLIIKLLERSYDNPKTALKFKSSHQLLVATILSAQCTDKRVNIVTKSLFGKYKKAEDYAKADRMEFENDIKSTGFFRNKAKSIIGASKIIVEKYKGKVPDKMEDLVKLPGVARKTANVVLYNAFGKNEGIAVDTHVARLSERLKLSKNTDPVKIESDLMNITKQKEWGKLSNLMILHGRNICTARRPKCEECVLNKFCPSAFRGCLKSPYSAAIS